jgi:hypothetical protein
LKKEGGFSLEMVDLNSPCSGADNWKASEASIGGTPGAENSVNGINPDSNSPTLDYVLVENDTQLILIFNEPLLQSTIVSTNQFSIQPNTVSVKSFSNSINLSEINITLIAPLQPKIVYTITVSGISDCSGNTIQTENIVSFGVAEYPDSGDVIINEVLFNPESFGSDFVELYNKSDKIIDLKNLLIVETDFTKRDSVLEFARITTRGYLLLPENFVALTADANYIKGSYFSPTPKNIINVSGMPNYPDQSGTVILMDTLLNKFDELAYEEKWHFALLDDKNGVSLERINYSRPTQDANNWQSAASTVGFATPAYKNSQYSESDNAGNTFWLQPESFSPDNDGYNDVLNLHYQFKESVWKPENHRLMVYNNQYLFQWHVTQKVIRSEKLTAEQKKPVGYFTFHNNKWVLVNQTLTSLVDKTENKDIPIGKMVELTNGKQLLLSKEEGGRVVVITLANKK